VAARLAADHRVTGSIGGLLTDVQLPWLTGKSLIKLGRGVISKEEPRIKGVTEATRRSRNPGEGEGLDPPTESTLLSDPDTTIPSVSAAR
jgi:hypothetical protein